jgi:hypothetical protein
MSHLVKSDFPVRKAKERQPPSTAAVKFKVMAYILLILREE